MKTWEKVINYIFIALAFLVGAFLFLFYWKSYQAIEETRKTLEEFGQNQNIDFSAEISDFWMRMALQILLYSLLPLGIFICRLLFYRYKWLNILYYAVVILYFLALCGAITIVYLFFNSGW